MLDDHRRASQLLHKREGEGRHRHQQWHADTYIEARVPGLGDMGSGVSALGARVLFREAVVALGADVKCMAKECGQGCERLAHARSGLAPQPYPSFARQTEAERVHTLTHAQKSGEEQREWSREQEEETCARGGHSY